MTKFGEHVGEQVMRNEKGDGGVCVKIECLLVLFGEDIALSGKIEECTSGAGDGVEVVLDVWKVDFLRVAVVWRVVVKEGLKGCGVCNRWGQE